MTSSFCLSVSQTHCPEGTGGAPGAGHLPSRGKGQSGGPWEAGEEGHPRGPESGGGGLCGCGAGMTRGPVYGTRPGPASWARWLRPTRGQHVPARGQWAEAPPRQAEALTGPRVPRTDRPCVPRPGSKGLTLDFNS